MQRDTAPDLPRVAITRVVAAPLFGESPPGGWSNEIRPADSIHTLIAAVALAFTNALGSHAIARGAHRSGIQPIQAVVDRLEEVQP